MRLADEDFFTGSETAIIGSNPTSTTMKIRKEASVVVSTDANGDVAINYIGGAFPNGLVLFQANPGDVTAAGFIVPRLSVPSTLTFMWMRCYAPGGSALGAGAGVRVNYEAVGW